VGSKQLPKRVGVAVAAARHELGGIVHGPDFTRPAVPMPEGMPIGPHEDGRP
jgi:hypothetical protein